MSHKKYQSNLFGGDTCRSTAKLQTHASFYDLDPNMIKSHNSRVRTTTDVYTPHSYKEINKSINQRLEFTSRLESPIPSAPQTVRQRKNRSQIQYSNPRLRLKQSNQFQFMPRRKQKSSSGLQSVEISRLLQSNGALSEKVEQLKEVICELTTSSQSQKNKVWPRIGIQIKKINDDSSSKIDINKYKRENNYLNLYKEEKDKNISLQKQNQGLEVLVKLLKKQLKQVKENRKQAEIQQIYRIKQQLEEQIEDLEAENAQLSDSLAMANNQLHMYSGKNKELELQLENLSKEFRKYQKHNNLILHSNQILESNFEQRKRYKDQQSFRNTSASQNSTLILKNQQISGLLDKIQQLQMKLKQKQANNKTDKNTKNQTQQFFVKAQEGYQNKIKQFLQKQQQLKTQISCMSVKSENEKKQIKMEFLEESNLFNIQIQNLKSRLINMERQLREKQCLSKITSQKIQYLQEQIKQNQCFMSSQKQKNQELQKQIMVMQSLKSKIQLKMEVKNNKIIELEDHNKRLSEQYQVLSNSIHSLQSTIQSLQTKKETIQKQKQSILIQKACLIKQIIHLKQEISIRKISEFQLKNTNTDLLQKNQQMTQKQTFMTNKLNEITSKIKQISQKYGYKQELQPSLQNQKKQPDLKLQILLWLEKYITDLKQFQQISLLQKEQQQKQYIQNLNKKLSQVTNQNSRLRKIMIQYNININQQFQDSSMQKNNQELNNNKSNQLQIIKQESLIRDIQIQKLSLIRKRLFEIQRVIQSKHHINENELGEQKSNIILDLKQKGDEIDNKIMDDIERALQKIKKGIVSKDNFYITIVKNAENEISQLKKQNQSVKEMQQNVVIKNSLNHIQEKQSSCMKNTVEGDIFSDNPADKTNRENLSQQSN